MPNAWRDVPLLVHRSEGPSEATEEDVVSEHQRQEREIQQCENGTARYVPEGVGRQQQREIGEALEPPAPAPHTHCPLHPFRLVCLSVCLGAHRSETRLHAWAVLNAAAALTRVFRHLRPGKDSSSDR